MVEQPSNPRELPDEAASRLSAGLGGDECEFEVRCDGEEVAWTRGTRTDALREAQHYAHVYGMDGATEIFEIHKTYTKVDA